MNEESNVIKPKYERIEKVSPGGDKYYQYIAEFQECELLSWNQLPDKEKINFDYVDEEDKDDLLFFYFRESWQTLDDYIIPSEPTEDFHGVHSLGYDTAFVVKDIEDGYVKAAYVYWSNE